MSMMYARNLVDLHLKYYADYHNVDEDIRSITSQGDEFAHRSDPGITARHVNNTPSDIFATVAYKYNKNSTPAMRVEF